MASLFARTARLAFQQYGAPALVAGGLMVSASSSSSLSPLLKSQWQSFYSPTGSNTVACEAGQKREESSSSSYSTSKKKSPAEISANPPNSSSVSIRRSMTNVGRFSLLSETPSNPSVPVLILCLSGKAWTARDFAQLYQERRIGETHERFRSVLDTTSDNSRHFIVPPKADTTTTGSSLPVQDVLAYPQIYRNELKTMITDALLLPMDLSQSLWQAWTATGGRMGQSGAIPSSSTTSNKDDVESLLLFRAHHCMADGVSLGAIFGDLMDEGAVFREMIQDKLAAFRQSRKKKSWWKRLQIFLYYWCWGSIRALGYQVYLYFSSLVVPNPWKLLQQQAAAAATAAADQDEEDHPHIRTLSWVQVATVAEVKQVANYFTKQHKKANPDANKRQKMTINDIFCSCATGATAKLMQYHRQQENDHRHSSDNESSSLSLPYLNLVIPVHMQGGILLPGQSMGNKIGAIVSQVPAEAAKGASDRLHQVHDTLWNRKQTPTAALSYLVAQTIGGTVGTILGPRVTSWLFSKAHANASVVVTNVRGPETAAHLGGRKVEANLGFLPLPPGVPIGVVVMSYDQKITLTVMAEPWAVPDADRFLSWVVEEYQELLEQSQNDGTQ
jgi:diacylglycerol O-acyltransferase